eukprot:365935-Chlamydomonas_euryale.AAC.1
MPRVPPMPPAEMARPLNIDHSRRRSRHALLLDARLGNPYTFYTRFLRAQERNRKLSGGATRANGQRTITHVRALRAQERNRKLSADVAALRRAVSDAASAADAARRDADAARSEASRYAALAERLEADLLAAAKGCGGKESGWAGEGHRATVAVAPLHRRCCADAWPVLRRFTAGVAPMRGQCCAASPPVLRRCVASVVQLHCRWFAYAALLLHRINAGVAPLHRWCCAAAALLLHRINAGVAPLHRRCSVYAAPPLCCYKMHALAVCVAGGGDGAPSRAPLRNEPPARPGTPDTAGGGGGGGKGGGNDACGSATAEGISVAVGEAVAADGGDGGGVSGGGGSGGSGGALGGGDASLLDIVVSQRDRFRARSSQLEGDKAQLSDELSKARAQVHRPVCPHACLPTPAPCTFKLSVATQTARPHSIHSSIDQATNQSIHRSINHSSKQPTYPSISQFSSSRSVSRSIKTVMHKLSMRNSQLNTSHFLCHHARMCAGAATAGRGTVRQPGVVRKGPLLGAVQPASRRHQRRQDDGGQGAML